MIEFQKLMQDLHNGLAASMGSGLYNIGIIKNERADAIADTKYAPCGYGCHLGGDNGFHFYLTAEKHIDALID